MSKEHFEPKAKPSIHLFDEKMMEAVDEGRLERLNPVLKSIAALSEALTASDSRLLEMESDEARSFLLGLLDARLESDQRVQLEELCAKALEQMRLIKEHAPQVLADPKGFLHANTNHFSEINTGSKDRRELGVEPKPFKHEVSVSARPLGFQFVMSREDLKVEGKYLLSSKQPLSALLYAVNSKPTSPAPDVAKHEEMHIFHSFFDPFQVSDTSIFQLIRSNPDDGEYVIADRYRKAFQKVRLSIHESIRSEFVAHAGQDKPEIFPPFSLMSIGCGGFIWMNTLRHNIIREDTFTDSTIYRLIEEELAVVFQQATEDFMHYQAAVQDLFHYSTLSQSEIVALLMVTSVEQLPAVASRYARARKLADSKGPLWKKGLYELEKNKAENIQAPCDPKRPESIEEWQNYVQKDCAYMIHELKSIPLEDQIMAKVDHFVYAQASRIMSETGEYPDEMTEKYHDISFRILRSVRSIRGKLKDFSKKLNLG